MDPLVLLQDYASRRKLSKVRLTETRVEFEDAYTFPRNAPTAYKSGKNAGDFYSLDTLLVFLLKGITLDATTGASTAVPLKKYIDEAKALKAQTVPYLHRKDLLDFLLVPGATSPFVKPAELATHLAATAEQDGDEPAAKRARLEPVAADGLGAVGDGVAPSEGADGGTAAFLAEVRRHERELRDRNSALSVPGKTFGKTLDIAARALKQMDPKAPQRPSSGHRQRESATVPHVQVPIKPSGRYERPAGEDTIVKEVGGAIQIQAYGPGAQPPTPAANGSGMPPPPPPERATQSQPRPARPPPPPDAARRHSGSSHHANKHDGRDRQKDRSRRPSAPVPLILVPKGLDTKLNMFNAQAFLEDGTYQSLDAFRAAGAKKPARVKFQRKVGVAADSAGRWYEVSDAPPGEKDAAGWQRVLAVFVQGKDWQFRGWPFKGVKDKSFVDLFNRVLGVYVHEQGEQLPEFVRNCNVQVLKLQKHDRHRDRETALQLYKWLDEREKALARR